MRIGYNLDSRLRGNDRGKSVNDKKDQACETKWDKKPVWIHGNFAIGNVVVSQRHCEERSGVAIQENDYDWIASSLARNDGGSMYKLSAVIGSFTKSEISTWYSAPYIAPP